MCACLTTQHQANKQLTFNGVGQTRCVDIIVTDVHEVIQPLQGGEGGVRWLLHKDVSSVDNGGHHHLNGHPFWQAEL